jgi:hypothetical protein
VSTNFSGLAYLIYAKPKESTLVAIKISRTSHEIQGFELRLHETRTSSSFETFALSLHIHHQAVRATKPRMQFISSKALIGVFWTLANATPLSTPDSTTTEFLTLSSASTLLSSTMQPMTLMKRSTRSTTFDVYGDTACKNYLTSLDIVWDDDKHDSVVSPNMGSDRYWQSIRWTGGDHDSEFRMCQFGNSCFNVGSNMIYQDAGICSSGGGTRFDKIFVN